VSVTYKAVPLASIVAGMILFVKTIINIIKRQKFVKYLVLSIVLLFLGLGFYVFVVTHLGAGLSDSLVH